MAAPLDRSREGPPPSLARAAVVMYSVLLFLSWAWLWLRGREDQLPATALGAHGLWVSVGAGTAVGLGMTLLFVVLERYLPPFAQLRRRLRELLGPLNERDITLLTLFSALGEELFFRLAMLDAMGLYWSAAIFGLLHVGPRGLWLWTVTAFALGLLFGWMVLAGYGLLSVTVAHALVNYFSLRRMERP